LMCPSDWPAPTPIPKVLRRFTLARNASPGQFQAEIGGYLAIAALDRRSALSKSVESRNLSVNRAAIRWTSVQITKMDTPWIGPIFSALGIGPTLSALR
jgi:hypothetical protein